MSALRKPPGAALRSTVTGSVLIRARVLMGIVASDKAARRRTEHTVMARIVTGDTADNRSSDAAFCQGGGRHNRERKR